MQGIPAELRRAGVASLFPPPGFLTRNSTGIDISDSSVKFLELRRRRETVTLELYGERPIPEGVVVKGKVVDGKRLSTILQAIRKEFGITHIRASLPEEDAYIYKATVPHGISKNAQRAAVEFHLEENVPIAPADAVFDFEAIKAQKSEVDHVDVAVTAYPRKIIDSYTAAFHEAGMSPISFEVEAQAVARSIIQVGDPRTYLIVDFGRARTGLAIVSSGVLLFTTTLEVGGNAMTEAIKKTFNVSAEEAEVIKNEKGFLRNQQDDLSGVLINTVSALRDEINKHFIYWHSLKDDKGHVMPTVEAIMLCGGNANLAGFPEYLSASMRVKVEVANVWRNIFNFDDVIPPIDREHSLGYATAIGLAMRDLYYD